MYHMKRDLKMKFIVCELEKTSLKEDEIYLKRLQLNDGYDSHKNVFESQEEALVYLENSSTPLVGKNVVILPYLKIGY
jgi:hypothetical protein